MTGESKAIASSHRYDVKLLFSVLFLVGIGIVMVYSASFALAHENHGSGFFFLKKQAFFSLIGIVVLVICSHIPYRIYRSLAYPILFVALGLLVCVLFFGLGIEIKGSMRWLKLGPVTFQPVELARLAMIVFMAYSLTKKQDELHRFSIGFMPHAMLLMAFAVLLLLQPDFGSVVIFAALIWIMMFIGGVPLRHLISILIMIIPPAYFIMMAEAYRGRRWFGFWSPWEDPLDKGYQIIRSLMAFGTGGLWGAGVGKGQIKMSHLPEPHTDFIFAVIGEELGFVGVLFVLALCTIVIWRGMRIAYLCSDNFGMLLAAGITASIAIQMSINMGVALNLLPPKGLTLPFLSYGGTSLVLNMAAVGILMNIGAKHGKNV